MISLAGKFFIVLNQFPHAYLTHNKRTIPISLVHVFVAISQRLGIEAAPLDYPGKVLVRVASPHPEIDDIFIDMFSMNADPILVTQDRVPVILTQAGLDPQTFRRYLTPCGGAEMLVRVARNILAATRGAADFSYSISQAALQTSICAHLLLTDETRLIGHLLSIIDLRPLDCSTFLSTTLLPLLRSDMQLLLRAAFQIVIEHETQETALISCRSPDTPVKYFVGAIFKHIRFGYTACIAGWDVSHTKPSFGFRKY